MRKAGKWTNGRSGGMEGKWEDKKDEEIGKGTWTFLLFVKMESEEPVKNPPIPPATLYGQLNRRGVFLAIDVGSRL